MPSKEDLRVVRTKKLLSETLITLMESKSIEHLSVMDLCTTAMVNRATFYKHFDDKYDLLCFALEDIKCELYDDFVRNINNTDTPSDTIRAVFATVIDYFYCNRNRVANILKHNSHGKVLSSIEEAISNSIIFRVAKYTEDYAVKIPLPLLAKFLAGGIVTTLLWCITQPDKYTYEEFITFTQLDYVSSLFEKI